jgi:hypothetical protein
LLKAGAAEKLGEPGIGYRCQNPLDHQHARREEVLELVCREELAWWGNHYKIAVYQEIRTWAPARSGPVTTMQLLPPEVVMGRRKRG